MSEDKKDGDNPEKEHMQLKVRSPVSWHTEISPRSASSRRQQPFSAAFVLVTPKAGLIHGASRKRGGQPVVKAPLLHLSAVQRRHEVWWA